MIDARPVVHCREECNSLNIPPHPEYDCHHNCLAVQLENFKRLIGDRHLACGECHACLRLGPLLPKNYWYTPRMDRPGFITNVDLFTLTRSVVEQGGWMIGEGC